MKGSFDDPFYLRFVQKTYLAYVFVRLGFSPLIVTAAADKGLIDIHDRHPLVLTPDAAREWLRESLSADEAGRTAKQGAVPAE